MPGPCVQIRRSASGPAGTECPYRSGNRLCYKIGREVCLCPATAPS